MVRKRMHTRQFLQQRRGNLARSYDLLERMLSWLSFVKRPRNSKNQVRGFSMSYMLDQVCSLAYLPTHVNQIINGLEHVVEGPVTDLQGSCFLQRGDEPRTTRNRSACSGLPQCGVEWSEFPPSLGCLDKEVPLFLYSSLHLGGCLSRGRVLACLSRRCQEMSVDGACRGSALSVEGSQFLLCLWFEVFAALPSVLKNLYLVLRGEMCECLAAFQEVSFSSCLQVLITIPQGCPTLNQHSSDLGEGILASCLAI
ncbi:hypothetical protein F2Q69_00001742 [Brassica cretica]|uniref:Uncharacterized protein n=1 Tax=Brassica cretica TaxID=69181 RepID=A0A8S9P9P3_BRACR|nr:hypothetical protein F2Q69_00001742 [Brassica cretica]